MPLITRNRTRFAQHGTVMASGFIAEIHTICKDGPHMLKPAAWFAHERRNQMSADAHTKAVLTVIAIALSIIALNPWIAPETVEAASQDGFLAGILSAVNQIANGSCQNTKICEPKQSQTK